MHPSFFYTMDKDVGTPRWRAIRGVYDRRGVHFDSAGVRPGSPIQHPPIRAKTTPPKRRPAAPPGPSTSPIPLIFPHFQNEGILEEYDQTFLPWVPIDYIYIEFTGIESCIVDACRQAHFYIRVLR